MNVIAKFNSHVLSLLLLPVLVSTVFSVDAMANGFKCMSVDQDAEVEIRYNSVRTGEAEFDGRASEMVIRNPTLSPSRQLIAKFSADDGLLNSRDGWIVAHVDITHPDSSKKGKRIGGTVLGSLRSILLEIDFSYEEPSRDGATLAAQVIYTKTNSSELTQDFECTRFGSSDENIQRVERAD